MVLRELFETNDTLKRIKKKIHLPRVTESIMEAKRQGIVVRTNLIIGFPHETRRDVFQTVRFVPPVHRIQNALAFVEQLDDRADSEIPVSKRLTQPEHDRFDTAKLIVDFLFALWPGEHGVGATGENDRVRDQSTPLLEAAPSRAAR
jgi:hypothetical protein